MDKDLETILGLIMVGIFYLIILSIYFKHRKNVKKKEKETLDLIKNTSPTRVELYDVLEYTQHSSDGASTMVRLVPVFKDDKTGQIYINSEFYEIGDINIRYSYEDPNKPKLVIMTRKGKIITEGERGHIYIRRTIGNATYDNNRLTIGCGPCEYDGKLKDFTDAFKTDKNTVFNIMKDNFIENISGALIVDAHVDFDMDDKANINPYTK